MARLSKAQARFRATITASHRVEAMTAPITPAPESEAPPMTASTPGAAGERELASEVIDRALRTYEAHGGALRYLERDKWHLCDRIAMMRVLQEFAASRASPPASDAARQESGLATLLAPILTRIQEQPWTELPDDHVIRLAGGDWGFRLGDLRRAALAAGGDSSRPQGETGAEVAGLVERLRKSAAWKQRLSEEGYAFDVILKDGSHTNPNAEQDRTDAALYREAADALTRSEAARDTLRQLYVELQNQEAELRSQAACLVDPERESDMARARLPEEPPPGLLMSIALRLDHGLGCPGYYDQTIVGGKPGTHARRLEIALQGAARAYEEIAGFGFYRSDREAEYVATAQRARAADATRPGEREVGQ